MSFDFPKPDNFMGLVSWLSENPWLRCPSGDVKRVVIVNHDYLVFDDWEQRRLRTATVPGKPPGVIKFDSDGFEVEIYGCRNRYDYAGGPETSGQ